MLRRLVLLFSLFAGFAFAENPVLTVSVPLAPYAKMVRKIAGERALVVTIVPKNANPHTFEPKPENLRMFSDVSIYFGDASGIDAAWRPRFLGVNPNARVVDVSAGVSFMAEDASHHGKEAGDDLDPHIWNSPRTAILVASNICTALVEADAPGAGFYRANLERFSAELSAMDARFAETVRNLSEERRTFIVFHPSYGYLARDYGLKQIAVEMDGKEPKPRDMQNLIRTAKKNRVKTVFVQPQFSRRAAETLSREIRANIVSIDPLAFDFDAELEKFFRTLSEDAE